MKNTLKTDGQTAAEVAIDDCLRELGADDVSKCRKAILAALDAAGRAIVPKEPTEAMLNNGACFEDPDSLYADHFIYEESDIARDIYRAMLAASDAGE